MSGEATTQQTQSLLLRYREDQQEFPGVEETEIAMGRHSSNTFRGCRAPPSSRQHATILFQRTFEHPTGVFLLRDHSRNGTYLTHSDGRLEYIHRTEVVLSGSGVIGMGYQITLQDPDAIHFECMTFFRNAERFMQRLTDSN